MINPVRFPLMQETGLQSASEHITQPYPVDVGIAEKHVGPRRHTSSILRRNEITANTMCLSRLLRERRIRGVIQKRIPREIRSGVPPVVR